jgi:CelD/BcsL family acetyltransferase involved in cellulose biosynthesis
MTPPELRVELVTRRSQIPLDAERWNALVAANETNTVFQTYEWFDAWWQTFGAGRSLFFLVVKSGDEVVGFAPFTRRRSPFGWRLLELAGTGNADYLDLILPVDKPRQLTAICSFLRARRFSWERLALYNVPTASSTHAALLTLSARTGLRVVDELCVPCPALKLAPDTTAARELIDKYSLRRPLNWFRKRGTVAFRHVASGDEIARLLPVFFEQHRRRWTIAGRYSVFSERRQRQFYETLVRTLLPTGRLQFSVVEFNGDPVAFHFGFDYAGTITWYKPTFDTRYSAHSPGLLLTRQLIEDGLARGRQELDFTIGDESFKERFSNVQRYNMYFGVYPSGISHFLAVTMRNLRRVASRVWNRVRRAGARRARLKTPYEARGGTA